LQTIGVLEKPRIETNNQVCNLSHVSICKEETNWDRKPMIYELKTILETKKIQS
jgi:hypothetical protein